MSKNNQEIRQPLSFRKWMFKSSGKSGITRAFINRRSAQIFLVAIAIVYLSDYPVILVYNTVIYPLFALLVGVILAWIANSLALLGSEELYMMAKNHQGGIEDYVYTFLLSFVVVFITIIAWIVSRFSVEFSLIPFVKDINCLEFILKVLLLYMTFVSLWSIWVIVKMPANLVIYQFYIKREEEYLDSENKDM